MTELRMIACFECKQVNDSTAILCKYCGKPIGKKFDENKTKWTLLPWEAIEKIAVIMMFGAKKYAPDNWKYVKPPIRYLDAAIRHITAWFNGEDKDSETGYSHLWHAGCCIVFAIWFDLRGELRPNQEVNSVLIQTRYLPCGCIACICDDPNQCHGCGAKVCEKHASDFMPSKKE